MLNSRSSFRQKKSPAAWPAPPCRSTEVQQYTVGIKGELQLPDDHTLNKLCGILSGKGISPGMTKLDSHVNWPAFEDDDLDITGRCVHV